PGVLNSTLGGAVFPAALTGGELPALGDIDLPHSYTAIGDVAAGLATLGERPESDGRVWHLPTAPAVSTREILALIEKRAGRPLNLVPVPEARPFGPFDEEFMAEYAEMFYQHTEPQIVDSSAFERAFEVAPTPLAETVDATVEWYAAQLGRQQ
ncbi:epimerase, partial [Streptomyces sp. NPDC003832]